MRREVRRATLILVIALWRVVARFQCASIPGKQMLGADCVLDRVEKRFWCLAHFSLPEGTALAASGVGAVQIGDAIPKCPVRVRSRNNIGPHVCASGAESRTCALTRRLRGVHAGALALRRALQVLRAFRRASRPVHQPAEFATAFRSRRASTIPSQGSPDRGARGPRET